MASPKLSKKTFSLFVIICTIIFFFTAQTIAFGYVPRLLIAQIAKLHNTTVTDDLQDLLTVSFDGYYKSNQYTFPAPAGDMYEDSPLLHVLAYNPTPFNLANDPTVIARNTLPQTNATAVGSSALLSSVFNKTLPWARAQNTLALLGFVPAVNNPTRCVNLFTENYKDGDDNGRLFAVSFTSTHTQTSYNNLHDAIDNVFGYYSPTTKLSYDGINTFNKTVQIAVEDEAKRLMSMFPAKSFNFTDITVPPKFTRSAIKKIFETWAAEANLLGMDIYNTFFNYPKKQQFKFSDEIVQSDLFPTLTQEEMDNIHELVQSSYNASEPVEITQEQQYYFRYLLLKQIAKAGYRLSSVLSRVDTSTDNAPMDKSEYVSRLFRAFTIVTAVVLVFILYFCFSFVAKSLRLKKKISSEATTLDQSLLNSQ